MATNTSYNLCLKELRTLETYKIKNQEQQHTSFTTTQVRRMLGTTQGRGTKVPKLRNRNSRILGNTLVMSKVTHDLPQSSAQEFLF